jgi:hypothetical protein
MNMRLPSGREDSGWNWITGGARFFRATSQRQHHSACRIDHGLVNMAQFRSLDRAAGWDLTPMYVLLEALEGTRVAIASGQDPRRQINSDAHLKKACYLKK